MYDWEKIKIGDVLPFGAYPTEQNGAPQPIIWRVIEANEEWVALLADKIIESIHYTKQIAKIEEILYDYSHFKSGSEVFYAIDYAGSELRDFVRSLGEKLFTEAERRRLLPQADCCGDTVGLLSERQITSLGCTKADLVRESTPLALEKLAFRENMWWVVEAEKKEGSYARAVGENGALLYQYAPCSLGVVPKIVVRRKA